MARHCWTRRPLRRCLILGTLIIISVATISHLRSSTARDQYSAGRKFGDSLSTASNDRHTSLDQRLPANVTSPQHDLVKRVPRPKVVAPYTAAELWSLELIGGGQHIQCKAMLDDIATADADISASYKMPDPKGLAWQRTNIEESGLRQSATSLWQKSDYDPRNLDHQDALSPIAEGLAGLPVGTGTVSGNLRPLQLRRRVDMDLFNDGPNIARLWRQHRHYDKSFQKNFAATEATVAAMYNVIDGVIITQAYEGAHWQVREENGGQGRPANAYPALYRWSDIVWCQWIQLHSDKTIGGDATIHGHRAQDLLKMTPEWSLQMKVLMNSRHWLNYIVMQGPFPEDEHDTSNTVLRIVAACLLGRGISNDAFPKWQERQTRPIGHWCYYALLGHSTNVPVAEFLIQHKTVPPKGLGIKVLTSVTIFWPEEIGNHPSISWPVLVWAVGDYTEEVRTTLMRVESKWIHTSDCVSAPVENTPPIGSSLHQQSQGTAVEQAADVAGSSSSQQGGGGTASHGQFHVVPEHSADVGMGGTVEK